MRGEIEIPVSFAELVDKITILEIKMEYIKDKEKKNNISYELDILESIMKKSNVKLDSNLENLRDKLKEMNLNIWNGEDVVREYDQRGDFDQKFIEVACSIRRWNDARAKVKRDINDLLGSRIVEEKGHSLG